MKCEKNIHTGQISKKWSMNLIQLTISSWARVGIGCGGLWCLQGRGPSVPSSACAQCTRPKNPWPQPGRDKVFLHLHFQKTGMLWRCPCWRWNKFGKFTAALWQILKRYRIKCEHLRLFLCTLAAARGWRRRTGPCSALHSHRCSQPARGLLQPNHPVPQTQTPAPCGPAPPGRTHK